MGERTARDELLSIRDGQDWDGWKSRHVYEAAVDDVLANRTVVLAALVESGGPLTDDELRACGGVHPRPHMVDTWHFPAAPDTGGAPT